jgi:hypothetical protein
MARAFGEKANAGLMAWITGAANIETGQQLARESSGFDFTPEEFKQTAEEGMTEQRVFSWPKALVFLPSP